MRLWFLKMFCLLIIATAGVSCVQLVEAAETENDIDIYLNGEEVEPDDQEPFIENGRTMVAIRFVSEELGHDVEWCPHCGTDGTVEIEGGGTDVALPVGEQEYYVGGTAKQADTAPTIVNNRTVVPLRVVSETLGAGVDWDGDNRDVIIEDPRENDDEKEEVYEVTGFVTNQDEERIEGAEILFGGETDFTDEDGRFNFGEKEPGAYHLEIYADGYKSLEGEVEVEDSDLIVSDLVLEKEDEEDTEPRESWDGTEWEEYTYENYKEADVFSAEVDPDDFNHEKLSAAIFYRTNEVRVEHDAEPLELNEYLKEASRLHAEEMVEHSFMAHRHPTDEEIEEPRDRVEYVGGDFSGIGENVAMRSIRSNVSYLELADIVVELWMDSEGHRRNMLRDRHEYLGVGTGVRTDTGRLPEGYFVQKFGR